MQKADEMRYKEERKIIAGYSSGRKAPEVTVKTDQFKSICIFVIYLCINIVIFPIDYSLSILFTFLHYFR